MAPLAANLLALDAAQLGLSVQMPIAILLFLRRRCSLATFALIGILVLLLLQNAISCTFLLVTELSVVLTFELTEPKIATSENTTVADYFARPETKNSPCLARNVCVQFRLMGRLLALVVLGFVICVSQANPNLQAYGARYLLLRLGAVVLAKIVFPVLASRAECIYHDDT
ncbi:hypothetical protein SPRG_15042 [Saprolegnia parasitica CBS 223.65]|uniref:Uncharacterized protein n=1 Tax=Saprolegnia parasitica (strain CBS 223.65) TaxID=695850 RepID=A0A067BY77_SAPPC|nr:hypothetical protein SPRG_15042 [Saprolegnia parasitica CBS 223.65]KDO19261.1 hypothetical protein SPRG_15042 [Saprolegnia parasitica CBS 223.65]|eukprot:XP_012210035.1 hypothetical protein SPRG_15042 [Saprolegnia parasitica CBS 223.65]